MRIEPRRRAPRPLAGCAPQAGKRHLQKQFECDRTVGFDPSALPFMNPAESEPPVCNLHLALTLYARESRAPFPLRRQNLMEIVRSIDADAVQLEQEITRIQQRLGSPDEQPDDLDRAKVAGHRLSNLMCLAVLMQGLKERQQLSERGSTPSIPLPAGTESPFGVS
jgi:hypothetical protein